MAGSHDGYIAFGREVEYGTPGTRAYYLNAKESISQTRERLREARFGSRSQHTADAGRVLAEGSLSDVYVRKGLIAELIRAAVGPAQEDGVTYISKDGNYDDLTALPSYTIFVSPGESVTGVSEYVYTGAQVDKLELSCESAGALTAQVDWLIKEIREGTFTPGSRMRASETELYTFEDLTIERNSVNYPFVEAVTISLQNDVQPIDIFNQDKTMVATSFESPALADVQMTLTFRDASTYEEFTANTKSRWKFRWEKGAESIEVSFAQLSIDQWSAPISTPGRLTVDVYAVAEQPEDGLPAVVWTVNSKTVDIVFSYNNLPPVLSGTDWLFYAEAERQRYGIGQAMPKIAVPEAIPTDTGLATLQVTSSGKAYARFVPINNVANTAYYTPSGISAVPQNADNFTAVLIVRNMERHSGLWRFSNPDVSTGSSWYIFSEQSDELRATAFRGNSPISPPGGFTQPRDVWYTFIYRHLNGRMQIFVDGNTIRDISVGTVNDSNTVMSLMAFYTGVSWNYGGQGDVHLAGFWNRALSDAELNDLRALKPLGTAYFTYDTSTGLTRDSSNVLTSWIDVENQYALTIPAGTQTLTDIDGDIGVISSGSALTTNLSSDTIGGVYVYAVVMIPEPVASDGFYLSVTESSTLTRAIGVAGNSAAGQTRMKVRPNGTILEAPGSETGYGKKVLVSFWYDNDLRVFINNTEVHVNTGLGSDPAAGTRVLKLLESVPGVVLYRAGMLSSTEMPLSNRVTFENNLMSLYNIPTDLASGLVRHWRVNSGLYADNGVTLASVGGDVQEWHDYIAGDVIAAPSAATQPTLENDSGSQAVYFNGSQYLENATSINFGNSARTVAILLKKGTSYPGLHTAFTLNKNPSAFRGNSYVLTTESGVRTSQSNKLFSNDPVSTAEYDVLVTANPDNAQAKDIRAFINGVELTASSISNADLNTNGTGGFSLGRAEEQVASGRFFEGRVASVAIWDRQLQFNEIANLTPEAMRNPLTLLSLRGLLNEAAYLAYAPDITGNTGNSLSSIGTPSAIPANSAETATLQQLGSGDKYINFDPTIRPVYYVQGGNTTAPINSREFTVVMIARSLSGYGGFWRLDDPDSPGTADSWYIGKISGGATLRYILRSTNNSSTNAITVTEPTGFYTAAIRLKDGIATMFLNGTQVGSRTITEVGSSGTAISLMGWYDGIWYDGSGDIFLAGQWNRALSDAELTELHNLRPV